MSTRDRTEHREDDTGHHLDGIGERLRDERVRAGLSQRELARRIGSSASLISQLESGQSKPSVGTLYAIVTELDISLDRVIRGEEFVAGNHDAARDEGSGDPVVRPDERKAVELVSGVRWEQLASGTDEDIDFLHVIYEVGGASTPDRSLMRHHGREYGFIISGTLGVQIGFEEYELGPGDAIGFDSTRAHRLYNKGDEPVRAIWFVVERDADDRI
ncbi:MAG TPA: cupin domain-containing protein [Acidimicrobiia bacterium]|nr:cupin domain-containing protein [Acidimicrobiia bacterium]